MFRVDNRRIRIIEKVTYLVNPTLFYNLSNELDRSCSSYNNTDKIDDVSIFDSGVRITYFCLNVAYGHTSVRDTRSVRNGRTIISKEWRSCPPVTWDRARARNESASVGVDGINSTVIDRNRVPKSCES